MNQTQTQSCLIAAPPVQAWTLLSAPQTWPWLSGGGLHVEFLRRDGERAQYRIHDAKNTENSVTVLVVPSGTHATLHLSDIETCPPALTWAVEDADSGCVLRWVRYRELPAALAALWSGVVGSVGAVADWATEVGRLRPDSDPVHSARQLAPMLRARAEDSALAATLDAGSVAAIKSAGLFRLGAPPTLGGLDPDPHTIIDTIAELATADGAAGWCTFIGNQSAYTAWFDELALKELAGNDRGLILAGSTAIAGHAEPTAENVYVVSGRWRFNSGCLHADWLMGGVSVHGADSSTPMLAVVPRDSATILGTWHVAGLAGTGSHDLVLDRVTVPARRLAPLFSAGASEGGTLHRLSPYNIQGVLMVGLPLGIARRALEELHLLSDRGWTGKQDLRVELARLEIELAAARALALNTVEDYWSELRTSDKLTSQSEARLALVLRYVVDTAKRIVSAVTQLAGLEAASHSALRRCLRDVFGVGQHLAVSDDLFQRNAKRLLPRR